MLPELTTQLFRATPPLVGQPKIAYEVWERGFNSFPKLSEKEAVRRGGQFLNGWRASRRVEELATQSKFFENI